MNLSCWTPASSSSSGRHLLGIRLLILAIVHGSALGTPSIGGHSQPATIVTGGDGSGLAAASADAAVGATVERYYFEHMIGEKDASAAFDGMADELINRFQPAWCPPCNKSIVRYCLDSRMLHDHCCCDSGHARDQLPWLPHSCYVGDNCQPNMKTCMQYTEIRECCCDRIMAKQWRDIRSGATRGCGGDFAAAAVFAGIAIVMHVQRTFV